MSAVINVLVAFGLLVAIVFCGLGDIVGVIVIISWFKHFYEVSYLLVGLVLTAFAVVCTIIVVNQIRRYIDDIKSYGFLGRKVTKKDIKELIETWKI